MYIRIKKNQIPERIYFEFMLLLGLFFGYFEVAAFWNAGIILLLAFLFLASKRFQNTVRTDWKVAILIIVLVVTIILNIIYTDKKLYLSYNLIQIVRPLLLLVSFYYVCTEKKSIAFDFLHSKFWWLNFMWVVNLIIIGLQVAGTGFMIKDSWMTANSYYEDNCTGVFGGSATHVVVLFTIFMLLYNLEIGIRHINTVWKKKLFSVYVYGTLFIMLVFSTLNDNMAMFIFVPLFLMWYYLYKAKTTNTRLFNRIISILKYIFLIGILFVVLQFIPGISEYINELLLERVVGVINYQDTNQLGSVERLAIVESALNSGFGWKFGKGIGAWNILGGEEGYAGYVHFGLSSVGSFVYLIGIWAYILFVLSYSCLLSNMNSNRTKLSFVSVFLMVNLLCFYTMFLTSTHIIVWSLFIFLILNSIGME